MNMILASGGPSPGTARVRARPRMHFWQALTSRASATSSSNGRSSPWREDSTAVRAASTPGRLNRIAAGQARQRPLQAQARRPPLDGRRVLHTAVVAGQVLADLVVAVVG